MSLIKDKGECQWCVFEMMKKIELIIIIFVGKNKYDSCEH